jgi:hypothetical protein
MCCASDGAESFGPARISPIHGRLHMRSGGSDVVARGELLYFGNALARSGAFAHRDRSARGHGDGTLRCVSGRTTLATRTAFFPVLFDGREPALPALTRLSRDPATGGSPAL